MPLKGTMASYQSDNCDDHSKHPAHDQRIDGQTHIPLLVIDASMERSTRWISQSGFIMKSFIMATATKRPV